jgi:hypothetical protein
VYKECNLKQVSDILITISPIKKKFLSGAGPGTGDRQCFF